MTLTALCMAALSNPGGLCYVRPILVTLSTIADTLPMHDIDPDRVIAALREAAALDVMPRFNALQHHEVMEKKPGDVVTVADLDAEHRLTALLPALLPGSVVVGEEAYAKKPAILNLLEEDRPVWLIDPVDGTKNFSEGNPMFCMMVALVEKGETLMSFIHDPTQNRTAVAEHGAGAFLLQSDKDGVRLHTPEQKPFAEMIGQINFGCFQESDRSAKRDKFVKIFGTVNRLRCAGHDFLAQSLGERDFALYNRLWSWDHVPGVLLLREAGGHVERIDDLPYRPEDRVRSLLSAGSKESWEDLRHVLCAD